MPVLLSSFSEALKLGVYEKIHTLVPTLNDAELSTLRKLCTYKPLKLHDRIFNIDDEANAIYFVLSGSVLCWMPRPDNKMLALDMVKRGGFFGEVATIGRIDRTASATALEPTEILILSFPSETHLDAFIGSYPGLFRKITQGMVDRLQRSANDLRDADLRDPEYSETPPLTRWDRMLTRPGIALGSYGFLLVFGLVLGLWFYLHASAGWDPNVLWLPLTLSIVQIVIGTLVLKSQLHIQKLDEEPGKKEREATMLGTKVIAAFERNQTKYNRGTKSQMDRIEALLTANNTGAGIAAAPNVLSPAPPPTVDPKSPAASDASLTGTTAKPTR